MAFSSVSVLSRRLRAVPAIVWLGVAVNVVLVFLPFYDPNDNTFFLGLVAFFSGHGPVLERIAFPGGFFEMALWVPSYLAYVASGFQLYWSYTTLKAVYCVMAVLSAVLLYRVGLARSRSTATWLAAFALLNPAMLYVSYVWVNWDAFPVFFVLLGFVILRYGKVPRSDHLRILLAVLALMVGVFFYWYPLVLLPALVLFSPTNRERWLLTAYSAGTFAALMGANLLLFTGHIGQYSADLVGGSGNFGARLFFGLPSYVGRISLVEYVPIVAVVALLLPVILRWLRLSEAAALFIVLALFVWTSPVQEPDNYAWIFWFVPLLLLDAPRLRLSLVNALGLSTMPLVTIAVVALTTGNGQPDGQGFFYWGFELFHWNNVWFPTLAERARVLAVGNVLLVLALVGGVLAVGWGTLGALSPGPASVPAPASVEPPATGQDRRGRRRVDRRAAAILVVLVLATAGAVAFSSVLPTLVHVDGSGPIPIYDLSPSYPYQKNVPRPIANTTFGSTGNRISIYTAAPPLVFVLPLDTQTLSFVGGLNSSGLVPQSTSFLTGSTVSVRLLTLDTVDAQWSEPVAPLSSVGVTSGSLGFPLMNVTSQYLNLGVGSSLTYAENASLLTGSYQYLSFVFNRSGTAAVPIFELQVPGGTVDFVSYPGYEALLYSNASAPGQVESVVNGFWDISGQWNYLVFRAMPTEFWFDFNGVVETFPETWLGTENGTLTIGRSTLLPLSPTPFVGAVTGLRVEPYVPGPFTAYWLNVTEAAVPAPRYLSVAGSSLAFDWESTASGTQVDVNGYRLTTAAATTSLLFGKATRGNYSVTFTVDRLVVGERLADRGYLLPVYAAMLAPFVVMAVGIYAMRPVPIRAAG